MKSLGLDRFGVCPLKVWTVDIAKDNLVASHPLKGKSIKPLGSLLASKIDYKQHRKCLEIEK